MISYRIKARALDALTLASECQAGNVTHTLDYIPGASIRGALAAEWEGEKGSADFVRLFESGDAIFENLRPMVHEREGYPIPLSTRQCKTNGGWRVQKPDEPESHGVQDFLLDGMPGEGCTTGTCAPAGGKEDGTQLVRSPGWYGLDGQAPFPIRIARNAGLHNEIEDEKGTPREGFLFALQEIPADTEFVGYVRLLDDDLQSLVSNNLPAPEGLILRVGRDRGRVRIVACEPYEAEPYQGKRSFCARCDADSPGGEFTLTLLSDAILRDQWRRFHRTLSEEYLRQVLGCGDELTVEACYSGSRAVSGWRATHHLPAPKVVAVAQGSAARLKYTGCDWQRLRSTLGQLERTGLGDQRAQGFGRVLVNDSWHELAKKPQTGQEKKAEVVTDRQLDDAELVSFLQRHPEKLLDESLARRTAKSLACGLNSGAQLSNLRNLALHDEPNQTLVHRREAFLDHELSKSNSKWSKGKDSIAPPADSVRELVQVVRGDALKDRIKHALVAEQWIADASNVTISAAVEVAALRTAIDHVTREAHSILRKTRAEGGGTDGEH